MTDTLDAYTIDDLLPLMEAAVRDRDLEAAHERADAILVRALIILSLEVDDDHIEKFRVIDRLATLYNDRRKVWWYA